jgi:hypothetical protein
MNSPGVMHKKNIRQSEVSKAYPEQTFNRYEKKKIELSVPLNAAPGKTSSGTELKNAIAEGNGEFSVTCY